MGRARDPEPGDDRPSRICPGGLCPETVLVARMTGGSYLLMAYPHQEPAAFVAGTDADLLHGALQAAFGYPAGDVISGNGSPAPEDSTKRVQP